MTPYKKPAHLLTALLIGLLLSACEPTSLPFTSVLQVAGTGQALYAYSVESRSWGPGCCGYGEVTIYESQDAGVTWQETASPPAQMQRKIAAAGERLSQTCDPEFPNQCTRVDGLGRAWWSTDGGDSWFDTHTYYLFENIDAELAFESLDYTPQCSQANPALCFRLNAGGEIESSMDGGDTWKIDWQFPAGRTAYLQRSYPLNRPGIPDGLRPLDLAVLDTSQGSLVIAAMGNQGALVRSPQGQWEGRAVGNASPLPDRAGGLVEAVRIAAPEAGRAVLLAGLFAILISAEAIVAGRFLAQRSPQPGAHFRLPHFSRYVVLYPLLLFTVLWMPFILWALGSISSLARAGALSTSLGLVVGLLGVFHTVWSVVNSSRQTGAK